MDILRDVPKQERKSICEAVRNIDSNKYRTSLIADDIMYLFEIWNQYVQPSSPQNINCKGCRTTVFSKYKHYVREWNEWNEQGESS